MHEEGGDGQAITEVKNLPKEMGYYVYTDNTILVGTVRRNSKSIQHKVLTILFEMIRTHLPACHLSRSGRLEHDQWKAGCTELCTGVVQV